MSQRQTDFRLAVIAVNTRTRQKTSIISKLIRLDSASAFRQWGGLNSGSTIGSPVSKSNNDSSSRLEKWKAGTPLGHACFVCVPREALTKYRKSKSDHERAALRRLMELELLNMLADGKLTALAIREGSPLGEGPVQVPPYLFPTHAGDLPKVDWDTSSINSAGHSFVSVRVLREKAPNALGTPTPPPKQHAEETPLNQPRRKPGPLSGAEEVIAAFNRMLQKGEVKEGMTTKAIYRKLLPNLKLNSTTFPNGRGLSYASIARHLHSHRIGHPKFSS